MLRQLPLPQQGSIQDSSHRLQDIPVSLFFHYVLIQETLYSNYSDGNPPDMAEDINRLLQDGRSGNRGPFKEKSGIFVPARGTILINSGGVLIILCLDIGGVIF